jgi:hypothetical protein
MESFTCSYGFAEAQPGRLDWSIIDAGSATARNRRLASRTAPFILAEVPMICLPSRDKYFVIPCSLYEGARR